MSDTKSPVYLDDDLLLELGRRADEAGVDRDAFIEAALRRLTAGQRLLDTLEDVATRSDLSEDEALELAYSERDAMRAERRASG